MGEVTARKMMQVAEVYGQKSTLSVGLNATALYELAAPSTPDSVRAAVEELLVDGEKVTVADIKKMKEEAKLPAQASA